MTDLLPSSEPRDGAKPRVSVTTVVPIVFLGLVCAVSMLGYNRQVRAYRLVGGLEDRSMNEFPNNKESIPETIIVNHSSFLSLNQSSTRENRAWLNKSFTEGNGYMRFQHVENSTERNTVRYRSCCGLGHRLTRLEDAAHVAMLYQAELHIEWADCGGNTFQQLFGSKPFLLGQAASIPHDDPVKYQWTFGNDVPGCYKIPQVYPEDKHLCRSIVEGKIQSSPKLYQELMDRYIYREKIQNFVQEHFAGKLAIGMHVRAGNNETGDFTRKNRQIPDMNAFVKLNADRVRSMMIPNKPAVLFIATDTHSYIAAFRNELVDTMPVVELEQPRAQDGAGVFFGEHGAPKPKGDECLAGWNAALQDMMLLASADIVFAPAYSSFTRTMPRVLALTRLNRIADDAFCEVWKRGDRGMVCYQSLQNFNADPPPMKRRRYRRWR